MSVTGCIRCGEALIEDSDQFVCPACEYSPFCLCCLSEHFSEEHPDSVQFVSCRDLGDEQPEPRT